MNPFTAVCGTIGELPCSQPYDNRWHITGRPQTRPLKFKIEREQVNGVSRRQSLPPTNGRYTEIHTLKTKIMYMWVCPSLCVHARLFIYTVCVCVRVCVCEYVHIYLYTQRFSTYLTENTLFPLENPTSKYVTVGHRYLLRETYETYNTLLVCGKVPDRNSVVVIATRNKLDGDPIPVGVRFSALVQTGPGDHPASCTMGTRSFQGVKRPGLGVKHPPPQAAMLEEE